MTTSPALDPLRALSNQMADAVARSRTSLLLVNGRQRQPGSGIVYSADHVLTADHVLEREDDLSVLTDDGRTVAARIVGRDPVTDLALLHAEGLGLAPAALSVEPARVGQIVLAVGRPSASGPMASLGVVSAVGGPLRTPRGMLEQIIQTDATPYPGFSGGPLIDAIGAVVGVLTTGLVGGAALALPVELAWRTAATLASQGHVKRGYLGISSQPVAIPPAQQGGGGRESGLLIVRVEPDTPAARAGLLVGDILVGLDAQPIADTDDLQALLSDRAGATVPAEILRGGDARTLSITIGTR
jgi:S1-C subfamily serine protease